jgi:hypothetical protein
LSRSCSIKSKRFAAHPERQDVSVREASSVSDVEQEPSVIVGQRDLVAAFEVDHHIHGAR